jgi:hypothetical protein
VSFHAVNGFEVAKRIKVPQRSVLGVRLCQVLPNKTDYLVLSPIKCYARSPDATSQRPLFFTGTWALPSRLASHIAMNMQNVLREIIGSEYLTALAARRFSGTSTLIVV